jgi:hypothetical protein
MCLCSTLSESSNKDRALAKRLAFLTVLRIRIRIYRTHMFLGLSDPDPLVRLSGMDPDPSIIMQQ